MCICLGRGFMIYPKQIADKIKEGIAHNQTPQEILCKLVLWQWDDFCNSLKTLKKDITPEQFLSAYFNIKIHDTRALLHKLESFKNKIGADVMRECLICK